MLSPTDQALAESHMTEMVGSSIGVILLAADDFPATRDRLVEAIMNSPVEAIRANVDGPAKTAVLIEQVREVRTAARGLHRILEKVQHEGDANPQAAA